MTPSDSEREEITKILALLNEDTANVSPYRMLEDAGMSEYWSWAEGALCLGAADFVQGHPKDLSGLGCLGWDLAEQWLRGSGSNIPTISFSSRAQELPEFVRQWMFSREISCSVTLPLEGRVSMVFCHGSQSVWPRQKTSLSLDEQEEVLDLCEAFSNELGRIAGIQPNTIQLVLASPDVEKT